MTTPFEFESLPPEIASVLNDVLNWRIAKEKGQYAIAEQQLALLDSSALVLMEWCGKQGAMRDMLAQAERIMEEKMKVDEEVKATVEEKRRGRKDRIARGVLSVVKDS